MNGKKLIISFVAVSIISLAVSAFAVITVARSYSQRLGEAAPEYPVPLPETELTEDASSPPSTEADRGERTEEFSPDTSAECNFSDSSSATPESETAPANATGESESTSTVPYLLRISGERLTVTDAGGNTVYERIIDPSSIRKHDLDLLLFGIAFPDLDSAISAIYDLIS